MANVIRHDFSQEEIFQLEKVVKGAILDLDNANRALGQLKLSKMSIRQKWEQAKHRYR